MTPESVRGWLDPHYAIFGVFLDGVLLERVFNKLITEASGIDKLKGLLSPWLCAWLRIAIAEKVIKGVKVHQHMGAGGSVNPRGIAAINFELWDGARTSRIAAINSLCEAAGLNPTATTDTDEDELKAMIAIAYNALQEPSV